MSYMDQIFEVMQTQGYECLEIENNRQLIFRNASGASAQGNQTLSLSQIQGILNEIMPEQQRALFASGIPFRFRYSNGSGAADIKVHQSGANLQVKVDLVKAAAQPVAADARIAEPSPLPPSSPALQELLPSTAAPESSETMAPFEAEVSEPAGEAEPADDSTAPSSLRANPCFPEEVHFTLQWPEARLRMLCAAIGVALGLGSSVLIFLLANREGMLGQMFNLRSLSTAIPISISCMFFWAVAVCCLRWRRLRTLERHSSQSLLLDATRFLTATGLAELAREIEGDICRISPLLRRLRAALQQWMIRPGLQDADLILQQHAASDEESVHAGYSLVRTFVWALPVLGLIGTVIGISLAVGGFARFLGGNIEDVAVIKQSLVGVTGGLSFAFLITLHGLLTSLLTMLAVSALQTREERLYTGIQQSITDIFLPALQRVAPAVGAVADAGESAAWREVLQQTADQTLKRVNDECLRLINVMDNRQAEHRSQITEWTQGWQREMAAGAGRLERTFEQVGATLAAANRDVLDHLSLAREALHQHGAKLSELSHGQIHAASQLHAELMAALSEQSRTVQATTDRLAGLTETTKAALEYQATLQSAIQRLGDSNLEQTFAGLGNLLAAQSREMQTMAQAVTGLNSVTGDVLTSQTTLQTAMRQLSETGLDQTLSGLRDSLVALKPVLAGFREPFVLRAVPLDGKAYSED